ncbi:hypothetical protein [Ligilactobacillus acidipiscis]|uniref:hypothetical protein n=1 Tax=Ligilactobacillus acidipiscis TaxID=89059 RepID=UPI0023F8EBB5|nr:hypothetical protein [Ligilactobacillus acidipiscis]WEV57624.1 hypothetical protein OZX66_03465 [Ligilactobacillus acidipiscis]
MRKFVTITTVFLLSSSLLAACGSEQKESSSNSSPKTQQVSGHKTTAQEKGTDKKAQSKHKKSSANSKQLEINYDDQLEDQKDYTADFTDESWVDTKVVIDKVEIDQVAAQEYDSANDGTFDVNGFVRLHMSVTPTRDINFYPTQGTAIYNDGQQQEATGNESWDGEIAKDATKDGWISFPVKELNNVTDLTSIRLKFTADYDTDDYEDDAAYQDYDLTLDLK